MASDTRTGPQAISGLAKWAAGLLIAQAIVIAVSVLIALRHGAGFADPEANPAYGVITLVQFLTFVVTGIVVLCWLYRACANVHAFGAQGLGTRPAMAVIWYFIPIASLVMPFQSMREIWKASREPRDWEAVPGTPLIGGWWFCWVVGNATGLIALRLEDRTRYPDAGTIVEQLTIASDTITIAASLLLARIIGRIAAMQATVIPR